MVNGIALFKDFAVVSEREYGIPHLRVIDFENGKQHRVEFAEPVYSVFLGANPEFDTSTVADHLHVAGHPVRACTSTTSPAEGAQAAEANGGARRDTTPTSTPSERIFATAPDGTKVPISLVYKKGLTRRTGPPRACSTATAPTGLRCPSPSTRPACRCSIAAWSSRRPTSAAAATSAGTGTTTARCCKKKNTFTDFIACADHLVTEKYCDRDRLAIQGGSAGGLLVGATINLRPDLCKAAVLQVPFVDVINTMLDESLPLTVQEFLEWGNPKKKEEYDVHEVVLPLHEPAGREHTRRCW